MPTTARIILETLRNLGVDKIFIVSGTDYPAFIEEKVRDESLPDLVVVPHEITAAAVAMGYSLGGKIGVLAVHTTPGTANALGVIMNCYISRIPLIVIAGRSPYTEDLDRASRNIRIHWPQEARDQGGIVRQWVKWEYEIRVGRQALDVILRGFQIAYSEPRGPIYIMIPREVSVEEVEPRKPYPRAPSEPGISRRAVEEASKMINEAERPVIIAWRSGRRREWFESLKRFADGVGIPVINYVGETLNYPSRGSMAIDSYDIEKADLLIVIENDVPWIPRIQRPRAGARVIWIDVDPIQTYIPYNGFQCDLCIQSTVSDALDSILPHTKPKDYMKEEIRALKAEQEEEKKRYIERISNQRPVNPAYLSYEIGRLASKYGLAILNEYPFNPRYADLNEYGSYFGNPSMGYLGWALGAAVGYRIASGRDAIAVVGDGSFIFGVPDAFYYIAYKYPVLVVIFDNGGWLASARAVKDLFPDGEAVKRSFFPGAMFDIRLPLGENVKSLGGYYSLVEDPESIWGELEKGYIHMKKTLKPSVIQVIVERVRS
ncbi:MAG: thiamine pyrophosphate-requiring protein [Sulfolobales archaeon]